MSRGKSKKIKKFSFEGCAGDIHIGMLGVQGQLARADSFLFPSFLPCGAGRRLRPDGAICGIGAPSGETTASDGDFPRSAKAGQDCNAVPDVCYRIAAPQKGKTATRGLPVRCTKAAGRRNLLIGWHRPCNEERMRPTYRRRTEKFRGWSGCHHAKRNPRRGCGVVAVVLGRSRCV